MRVAVEADGAISTDATGLEAVRASAEVLKAQIQSQTVLRLGLYVLASLFVIVSALLVVFAPAGRENLSGLVALSLFALAAGCAGFTTFAIKTPFGQASAGQGRSTAPPADEADDGRATSPGRESAGRSSAEAA